MLQVAEQYVQRPKGMKEDGAFGDLQRVGSKRRGQGGDRGRVGKMGWGKGTPKGACSSGNQAAKLLIQGLLLSNTDGPQGPGWDGSQTLGTNVLVIETTHQWSSDLFRSLSVSLKE